MERYELIVVGSGPGGIGAATAYRDAHGPGRILVLTADADPPYMRPPLSKDSLAQVESPSRTPLADDLDDIEIRLNTRATGLDMSTRTLIAGREQVGFDRLVLALGARPVSLPGLGEGVQHHELRTLADLRRLHGAAHDARSAVVIGSGFIGCEAAASLAQRGLDVTVVTQEHGPQRERLGQYVADEVSRWLRDEGITLRTGVEVASVEAPRQVHLSDGTTLDPDLLLVVVGVEPWNDLVKDAGLTLDQGRVRVDEQLRATQPQVYAAGDIALADHPTAGRAVAVEHWGDAEEMGRIAGHNAAGAHEAWSAVPGFWSQIGGRTLKYAAWGDGYERLEVVEHHGGFTVWYADSDDVVVGVLTHEADEDYERGGQLVAQGASLAEALRAEEAATPR